MRLVETSRAPAKAGMYGKSCVSVTASGVDRGWGNATGWPASVATDHAAAITNVNVREPAIADVSPATEIRPQIRSSC